MTVNDAESLRSALAKAKFPVENHSFIQHITDEIGVTSLRFVDSDERYIVAARRDGLGELRIYSGYTIRFIDEDEARRVGVGADTIRLSYKRNGGWLVSHPKHGDLERRVSGVRSRKRDEQFCKIDGCGYQLSARGKCSSGDH